MSKISRFIKNIEFVPRIHDIFIYPYRYASYFTRRLWYRSYYGKSLVVHLLVFIISSFYGVIMSFFFIDKKFSNINVSVATLSSLNSSIKSSIARMPKVENVENNLDIKKIDTEIQKTDNLPQKTEQIKEQTPKESISKSLTSLFDKISPEKTVEKDANVNVKNELSKIDKLMKKDAIPQKSVTKEPEKSEEKATKNASEAKAKNTQAYREIGDNTGFGSSSGVQEVVDETGDQKILSDKIIISKYLQKKWNSVNISKKIPNDVFVVVVVHFNQGGYITSYEIMERRYILQEKNDIYLYMCSKVREILDSVEKIDGLDPNKYQIWQKSRVNFRNQNVE